jgi:hypothetical protein
MELGGSETSIRANVVGPICDSARSRLVLPRAARSSDGDGGRHSPLGGPLALTRCLTLPRTWTTVSRRVLRNAWQSSLLPPVAPAIWAQQRFEGDVWPGRVYNTVFIFECRDGKIIRETAYWSKPFPAAEWRSAWVEKTAPAT